MNAPAPLPVIDSREAWAAALRWGFDTACSEGARCITCVDPGFEHWPLNDAALLQTLTTWARLPQRRLVLLAARFDEVPRRHPRFTAWRRDWAHVVQAFQSPPEFAAELPSVLLDDRLLSAQLLDADHWRGRAALDRRAHLLLQERVDVVLQRSEPAFAVTTLGL
jgi:hypothetical protein